MSTATQPTQLPTTNRGLPPRRQWLLPALLGLMGVAVTAAGSWIPSMWGDEAATVMSAERSWGSLFHEIQHVDAVHATYYAFMHVWIDVFGTSPFSLRFPSAIAVGVAVAGVVVLVRLLGGTTRQMVLVGIMTAFVPRLTSQGINARAYALDAGIMTWVLVFAVLTISGRIRARTGWIVTTVLLVVGTYFFMYDGLMAVVVLGLLFVLAPRERRRRLLTGWAISAGVLILASVPLLVLGYLERAQVAFLADRVTTDPYSLWVTTWFAATPAAALSWPLVAIAVIVAVRQELQRRRPRPTVSSLVWLALLWGFVPGIILVGANPFLHEYSARYMTFTAPAAGILVGLGLDLIFGFRRWLGILAAVVSAAVLVPTWAVLREPTALNASDWAIISKMVHERAKPGDIVAFDVTVRPSRRMLLAMRTYPQDYVGLEEVQVTTPFWENSSWDDRAMTVDEAAAAGRFTSDRVWLLQDAHGGTVNHEGEAALQKDGYKIVGRWRAPTSELVEFQR